MSHITIIILAAGSSSRMGSTIKQLLPFNENSFLGNTINLAVESDANDILCVLGAYEEEIKSSVDFQQCKTIINRNYKEGIGSSIAYAMKHVNKTDAVLFLLADQPLLTVDLVNQLINSFKSNTDFITATQYEANNIGVPAIFPAAFFPSLAQLTGDKGAKKIIMSNKDKVKLVTAANDSMLMDVDTLEVYDQLENKKKPRT